MKTTQLACLLMLCLTGCSGLSGFKRSSLPTARSAPQATVGGQTTLADPSNQELAIAWETAQLAEQRGMDQEAIAAYLQVRKHDPGRAGVAHALAVLYDRSGMTDSASREYRAALEESPDDANVHCDYGYFLYSSGDSSAAESRLREALRLEPEHQQATINLALVVGSGGRYDEAQALFTQAIGPAAALHNVGMLRLRAGDVQTAKTLLAEAQRRDPSIKQGAPVLARLGNTMR